MTGERPGPAMGKMRFEILGSLRVHDGERFIEIHAIRRRVLLAALLTKAGQAVPVDELAELVWDGAPPGRALATLRTHVGRLRRDLGPVAGSRIVTQYPGYLAKASPGEVDMLRFVALCQQCGTAAQTGQWERVFAIAGEALRLWRGQPLADIPSDTLARAEVPICSCCTCRFLNGTPKRGCTWGSTRIWYPGCRNSAPGTPCTSGSRRSSSSPSTGPGGKPKPCMPTTPCRPFWQKNSGPTQRRRYKNSTSASSPATASPGRQRGTRHRQLHWHPQIDTPGR